jgi:cysteine-rich repeat protein
VRAIAVCGNTVTESPAEDCDDGNVVAGDGCSPDCRNEAPLEGTAADCVAKMNDRAIRVSKTQGKENLLCLSAAAAGKETDADACITADARQKVEKARAKLASTDAALCMTPPPFGYEGAAASGDAAENQRRAFVLDLFGTDLSTAVLTKSANAEGAACQKAIAKAADKVFATALAAFLSCKVDRIESRTATAAESLEGCYDDVASQAADEGSRLGMALDHLATARLKKCAATGLAAAFPGGCADASGEAFDACVTAIAACRTCRTFDLADGLTRDCDLFDNGAADSSCAP